MADDAAPLASFSLTHVFYDPSDPISHACAWLALLPQCLCVVYATLVISTREAEVALMFGGQLACEAANFALKRLIKEQRPRFHGKGYGMPSSHAQFMAFWAVAVALFMLVRHRPLINTPKKNTSSKRTTSDTLVLRVAASAGACVLALAVAWSRVYLGYHSPRQVVVGAVAGVACAVAWFGAVSGLRHAGVVDAVLEVGVVRWLRVRDLLPREDLCQAGWEKWEIVRVKKGE